MHRRYIPLFDRLSLIMVLDTGRKKRKTMTSFSVIVKDFGEGVNHFSLQAESTAK